MQLDKAEVTTPRRRKTGRKAVTAAGKLVQGKFRLLPLHPRTTLLPEEKSILGVIKGVFLADMNAATPLGFGDKGTWYLVLGGKGPV